MSAAAAPRPPLCSAGIWRAPLHDFPVRDEVLYQYLPLSADTEALEIGPGSGFTAFSLARHVKHLTLLDVAPGNVAYLEDTLRGWPNLRVVCADLCKPRLAHVLDREFDAIYGLEVFELLPDPALCLENLASVLRPGGRLLLQFPNYPPPRTPGVTYFTSRGELEALLRRAGFSSWSLHALRLRPHARLIYGALHERPLRLYRRLRRRRGPARPLVYDESWAFNERRRLQRVKPLLHGVWMVMAAGLRMGGDCFEETPLGEHILNHNLLLLAQR